MDIYEASHQLTGGAADFHRRAGWSRVVLERVLSAASWSPFRIEHPAVEHLCADRARRWPSSRRVAVERVAHGEPWDERQYEMYPPAPEVPRTGERRSAFGKEQRPTAHSAFCARGLGKAAPTAGGHRQLELFRARPPPCSATSTATWGRPQWADVGMYLQTVMLLLRAEGLHSCPQMAWSQVRETVAEILSPLGRAHPLLRHVDRGTRTPTVSYARTGRAPLDETVRFVGG